jgi:hypothetical protein
VKQGRSVQTCRRRSVVPRFCSLKAALLDYGGSTRMSRFPHALGALLCRRFRSIEIAHENLTSGLRGHYRGGGQYAADFPEPLIVEEPINKDTD